MLPQEAFIDCRLGSNPYGPPVALDSVQLQLDASNYLKPQACDELAYSLGCFFDIDPSYLCLNGSSAQAITTLFSRYLVPKDRVMFGLAPQFVHAVNEWLYNGGRYKSIDIFGQPCINELSLADQFLSGLREQEPDVVYIDNPNNPTGHFFEINEIYEIVKECKYQGIICIIDEAYIDFIAKEHSAIYLVPEFDNLIVLRSLSKGLGLAALRIGFTVAQPQLRNTLERISTPFPIATPSLFIAQHVFDHVDLETYLSKSAQYTAGAKFQIVDTCNRYGLEVATTHPHVPIFVVYSKLIAPYEFFKQIHIMTTKGSSFSTNFNGPTFTRLRVPQSERELHQLCDRIANAAQHTPEFHAESLDQQHVEHLVIHNTFHPSPQKIL